MIKFRRQGYAYLDVARALPRAKVSKPHSIFASDLHQKLLEYSKMPIRALTAKSCLRMRFRWGVIFRGVDMICDLESALGGGSEDN